ncbi:XdhC family protein [Neobacillus cucumis]|uniref:XdhC family protein n=1 Tax=Neobacillus cucumis TaxID=1740721 RepID=UPI0018DF7DF2|nr:XdhC/CoxI family protein [Neobacillus cucumis]MBI0576919.1 XdhC family protein [Neobacillus cucumis]
MSRLLEFRTIFQSIKLAWEMKKKTAIVMLIGVNGSAYRLPGTKMMMTADGEMNGTISGGCLENDIFAYVEQALKENIGLIKNYDLNENEIWTLGIGCKGSLEILILPVQDEDPFWKTTEQFLQNNEEFSFILEVPTGTKAIIAKNGEMVETNGSLPQKVFERALTSMKSQRRAEIMEVDGRRFVIDIIRSSQRLIIAGAGKDAIPVADLAAKTGFTVTVLDPRNEFNNNRYFPNVEHIIQHPESLNPADVSDAWWVIMNHLQNRDEAALLLALKSNPKYIGVLGPISRTKEMLETLGGNLPFFDKIHSPVGLDIGAETVDEVAVSIVAELMMVRSMKSGTSLKGKMKIHA